MHHTISIYEEPRLCYTHIKLTIMMLAKKNSELRY